MNLKSIVMAFLIGNMLFPEEGWAREKDVEYLSKGDNDLQLRTGLVFQKNFARKFSIRLGEEFRLKDSFREVDRLHSEVDLSFDPIRWLKVAVVYRLIAIDQKGKSKTSISKRWELRHRLSFNASLSYKTSTNWKFSLKERLQSNFMLKGNYDPRKIHSPMWLLRTKLQVDYKLRHFPLAPYTYLEVCNTLNAPALVKGNYIEKTRSALGTEYIIDRHNSIDLVYIFDYNINKKVSLSSPSGELISLTRIREFNHIISVSYKYKF